MPKPNPNYYAIITAPVRYDPNLSPNAKLLYGEISALAQSTGTCWASNRWFAELYQVTPTTVSEWIAQLQSAGHIQVYIDTAAGNRRSIQIPIPIMPKTSSGKAEDPSSGKAEDNNTSVNNKAQHTPIDQKMLKVYECYLKYFVVGEDGNLGAAMRRYKLTPKRVSAIERRLKDADFKILIAAIVGYGRADWSNGKNDRKWKADLADFICRNYENVERGARLYEDQAKTAPGTDAWAKL